jgi:hypothetical protein
MKSLLKTDKMLLFIIAFFAFIFISYELNYHQVNSEVNNPVSSISHNYLSAIQEVNISQEISQGNTIY